MGCFTASWPPSTRCWQDTPHPSQDNEKCFWTLPYVLWGENHPALETGNLYKRVTYGRSMLNSPKIIKTLNNPLSCSSVKVLYNIPFQGTHTECTFLCINRSKALFTGTVSVVLGQRFVVQKTYTHNIWFLLKQNNRKMEIQMVIILTLINFNIIKVKLISTDGKKLTQEGKNRQRQQPPPSFCCGPTSLLQSWALSIYFISEKQFAEKFMLSFGRIGTDTGMNLRWKQGGDLKLSQFWTSQKGRPGLCFHEKILRLFITYLSSLGRDSLLFLRVPWLHILEI